jgi:predicted secreted protein with PEFG-CTERM motif
VKRQTLSIFAAISVLIAMGTFTTAYAVLDNTQSDRLKDVPILMSTDRKLYIYGSDVMVKGIVANLKEGTPITVTVTNPQGNVIEVQQIDVKSDRTFSTVVKAHGILWNKDGFYTIRVQYGPQGVNDKTSIEIIGATGVPTSSACTQSQILVTSATDGYCISYEISNATIRKATVSAESSAVTISLDTRADGSIMLIIPRNILDSKSAGGDSPFVVLADGQPVLSVDETSTTGSSRTLFIEFPDNTRELEIIGTYAVPEFGALAAIVLAVAIVSIIAVSARTRLLAPKL